MHPSLFCKSSNLVIMQCVDQAELEKFDGVSQGKYTIGLGQTKMSFCDDREGLKKINLFKITVCS